MKYRIRIKPTQKHEKTLHHQSKYYHYKPLTLTPSPILLYLLILWAPPLHELGHALICTLTNTPIQSISLDNMIHITNNQLIHLSWDILTAWIPFAACLIFLIKYYEYHTQLNLYHIA
jgi:hypothetical protein